VSVGISVSKLAKQQPLDGRALALLTHQALRLFDELQRVGLRAMELLAGSLSLCLGGDKLSVVGRRPFLRRGEPTDRACERRIDGVELTILGTSSLGLLAFLRPSLLDVSQCALQPLLKLSTGRRRPLDFFSSVELGAELGLVRSDVVDGSFASLLDPCRCVDHLAHLLESPLESCNQRFGSLLLNAKPAGLCRTATALLLERVELLALLLELGLGCRGLLTGKARVQGMAIALIFGRFLSRSPPFI